MVQSAPQAAFYYDAGGQQTSATQNQNSGDVLQLPDGRVGVVQGLAPKIAGDAMDLRVKGVYNFQKQPNINILRGGRVYWQRDNGYASFKGDTAGFYVGRAAADSFAAQTTVAVDLNEITLYRESLSGDVYGSGLWSSTPVKTAGSPSATRNAIGAGYLFALDTTSEAQKIDALSVNSVRVQDGPIFEGRLTIANKGNNAAYQANFGLASGTNATAFGNVTQHATFQFDGNSLELYAEATDGTNVVAATDTTLAAVIGTYNEFWIDARNPADVCFYVDGVQVLSGTTFSIAAAVGPLFPILYLAKTSNATPGQISLDFLRVRTQN